MVPAWFLIAVLLSPHNGAWSNINAIPKAYSTEADCQDAAEHDEYPKALIPAAVGVICIKGWIKPESPQ